MRAGIAIRVVAAATAIAAALAILVPFTVVDGLADDAAAAARVAIFGEKSLGDAAVVVLALDERSMATPPLDATPRALMSPVWAALAGKALQHGATAVALDFIVAFDGGAFRIGDARPLMTYDNAFLGLLLREGRKGRLVIGRSRDLTPARRFAAVARDRGMAFVDLGLDADNVVRRIPTGFTLENGKTARTLAGAMLQADMGEIPVTPPAPLATLPAASVIDVLQCDDPEALTKLFKGRAVVVGSSLPGEDRLRTPDRFMAKTPAPAPGAPCAFVPPEIGATTDDIPGAFLHAAAVDARVSGWALTPAAPPTIGLAAALVAALAALAGLRMAPAMAGLSACVLGAIGFAGAAWAQEAGVLFPAARPALAALVGFAAGWAGRLLFLDRRARALRASFGRYVAPELVDRILAQDKLPELDGEQRDVTIMFADLSGFTALSERVDGKTLTATVNAYLSIIAEAVEASGGYVDKFIGDAVMAMWNAPAALEGHERAAVRAAVAIRDAVDAAAARDAARGLPSFAIKVGVNSGPAIVGNVGAQNRLNYTAVGDTVNIAARMEGLPSVFATPIVLGAACAEAAADDFAMLEIASIQVKGRAAPVAVYAPLAPSDRAHFRAYEAALAAYRDRDFQTAETRWRALAAVDWNGGALAGAMAGFAALADASALAADWSGAVVMQTK